MNLELFMKTPAYISTTNMVAPIANITFIPLYTDVVDLAAFAWQLVSVFIHTFTFIAKEAVVAVETNLSFAEKMLLCLCLYNLIASFVHDIEKMNENKRFQEKMDRLQKMENDVKFLKKSVIIRNSCEGMWAEEIQNIRKEQADTIKEIERELSLCKETLFTDENNIVNRLRTRKQKKM
jgi:hypothetical protein